MVEEDEKIEVLDENMISETLDAAIRKLLAADLSPGFAATRYYNDCIPAFTLLVREADIPAGHVSVVVREVSVPGGTVAVAGVQNVVVAKHRRGSPLAGRLMQATTEESRRRGLPFGMLFCFPKLEHFYGRYGWKYIDNPIVMKNKADEDVPLTAHNIAMIQELSNRVFPAGPVHLNGRDW